MRSGPKMPNKEKPGLQKVEPKEAVGPAPRKAPHTKNPASFENLRNTIEARLSQVGRAKADRKPHKSANETSVNESRGKKRARNGVVLQTTTTLSKPSLDSSVPEDEFEKEVRALGGTHEDIELFADAHSDSELEGTEQIQNKGTGIKQKNGLEKGISNILREIALAQGDDGHSEGEFDDSGNTLELDEPQDEAPVPQRKGKSGLRCEPRPDWSTPVDSFSATTATVKNGTSSQVLSNLQDFAHALLQEENDLYSKTHRANSSHAFYNTVITSGTLSDKISALTLAVQETPIHNKRALETLFTMSKKRNRSQAVDVLRALKDLMAQGSLLPASRRLFSFATQPMLLKSIEGLKSWHTGDKLPKSITEQYLILWAFESWLKVQYFEMLQTLEIWCNDEIEFAKSRALSYIFELLKERPEQESNLLRLIVNKLGDPVKKIASQASYSLMQLLIVHPAMKHVVVSAIETDFIFRPGQSLHGKYYATVTLNQTALSANEEDVAQKLLGIYFGLFSALLKGSQAPVSDSQADPQIRSTTRSERQRRKTPTEAGQAQTDELREKLASALLTGVNRAFPYADADHKSFDAHIDTLFTIAHSANFNTSVQAMLLIQQLSASHQPSNDRFYRLLYESLLDPRLITASKQQLYLNLVHRALKADLNTRRVKAFVKRITQILSLHEPSFICGAFFLLKDLESSFAGLTALTDQAEELDEDEELFRDVDQDGKTSLSRGSVDGVKTNLSEAPSGRYDGHKRAPEHANADRSCVWEVLPFLAHFHPAVTVSADQYIRHDALPGKPDLTLHTLIHFLDRFVYRNAKVSDSKMRGSSIMQPMANDNTRAVLLNPTSGGSQRLSVNSEAFKAKKDEDVAAEDVFFHKYFSALGKESKKGKKSKTRAAEIESDDEDAVWKAMLDTAPDLEGAEDSDDEDDLSDLEAAMGESLSAGEADDVSGEEDVDVEAGLFDDEDENMDGFDDQADVGAFAELDSDLEGSDAEMAHKDVALQAKQNQSKGKRKTLKGLPTFASVEDYAKMLEDDEDEDIGT